MDLLNLDYEKYSLHNGLEVILYRDNSLPVVAVNIWYKVGSSDEEFGKSGIAHLFEHMMFQGSLNVPKEMHFKYIQEAGGNLNGSTSLERTNYYEKAPSNYLELMLWLESDRMGFLLPSLTQEKLNNQIDVVKNERLERYDNHPYGLAFEILLSNLYPQGHPLSWPTIGSLKDISGFTLSDVSGFFEKYYSPSNASIVVAGDFDSSNAKELIEKYFANIPGRNHISKKIFETVNLKENKLVIHKDNVQLERIYLAWHSDKTYSQHDTSLEILSDIITGSKNSRLYKKLVFESEIAQDISSFQYSNKQTGNFIISSTAKPGIKLNEIKQNIFSILEEIRQNGVSEKELQRSKNGIISSFIYSMQNVQSIADRLNSYNFYLNEPNSFNFDLTKYKNVQSSEIQAAIEKYLLKPYVELHVIPNSLG